MSMITKCTLASQNTIPKINLHESILITHCRSHVNLPFNPISSFPTSKCTMARLTTTTRWNSMIVYANVEPGSTPPPPPPGSSSGSWKNWVIGILMTFIVPLVTTKGGPIKLLMQKVDQIVDTAEHITDVVEAVADKVDKVIEDIEDDLPEGSQIRKTLDYIENVAERVEKDAHTAGDFIDKVQEMEDKMEDMMEPVMEEAMKVAKETREKEKAKRENK